MDLVRKYLKLDWFDFVDVILQELDENPVAHTYIELMDELYLRKLESVSEGSTFKLRKPAKDIFNKFEKQMSQNKKFANDNNLNEIKNLLETILE